MRKKFICVIVLLATGFAAFAEGIQAKPGKKYKIHIGQKIIINTEKYRIDKGSPALHFEETRFGTKITPKETGRYDIILRGRFGEKDNKIKIIVKK